VPIPLWTTTVTVLHPAGDPYAEPYGAPQQVEGDTGVRAVIDAGVYGASAGTETQAGGEQTRTVLRLLCDPCDLTNKDWVRDDTDGVIYRVVWMVHQAPAHRLAHIQSGIELVEGLV
jgi:hypothetical protein